MVLSFGLLMFFLGAYYGKMTSISESMGEVKHQCAIGFSFFNETCYKVRSDRNAKILGGSSKRTQNSVFYFFLKI